MTLPILYSYRRCPYAMRARMALSLAGIDVEIRDISLRSKPVHMIEVSPKATVPVLVLLSSEVIDESLKIMQWALRNHPLGTNIDAEVGRLISENDSQFKHALDSYKYPERYPHKTQKQHREAGEEFLQKLENLLLDNIYLLSNTLSFADIAIFPFIRQFAAVDNAWFTGDLTNPPYPKLQIWLNKLVESDLFLSVMKKQPTYFG